MVVSEQEGCISVLKKNGSVIQKPGVGTYTDITIGDDDNIYVVDTSNHQVVKFLPDGATLVTIAGRVGWGPLQFKYPKGIAFNPKNKKLYITNTHNHEVQVLNSDLTFYKLFGEEGKDKTQFNEPWGITCDSSGRVLVADHMNNRIQVFTAEGKFLKMFGTSGEKPGEMRRPTCITTDATSKLVYVSEGLSHRVSVFQADGQFLKCFGDVTLTNPRGMTVDGESGAVFVCDYERNRIQVY